jgi:hypothetical protein
VLGIVVLLSLTGGAYAVGRSSDPAPATMSAQRASGTSSLPLMTWAQRRTDDAAWMHTHNADVRWMRNRADACGWVPPRSRAQYWMRTEPNAGRPAPRCSNRSGWANHHRDWTHKGWHDNYQRR